MSVAFKYYISCQCILGSIWGYHRTHTMVSKWQGEEPLTVTEQPCDFSEAEVAQCFSIGVLKPELQWQDLHHSGSTLPQAFKFGKS